MWTLITGAGKGLGANIAISLAKKGRNIVIHYNSSENKAKEVANDCKKLGVKAEILQGDFSTLEGIQQFTDQYKKKYSETSALINNVGNYIIKPLSDTTYQEWTALFQTNLHAPFFLIQELIPSLIYTQGSIINIGVAGVQNVKTTISSGAYSITKSSLWMLTKYLAKELAEKKSARKYGFSWDFREFRGFTGS